MAYLGVIPASRLLTLIPEKDFSGNYTFDLGTLYIDSGNNEVGIGITTPTSNLHVIGTANITSNVVVGGSVTAIDFNSVSDMVLKENIQPIHNSFDILSRINPVSFKWKDRNETSYGVVAQDIEKVLPEIVNTNESGVKSVAYIQLIAFLIDAVNTLQKEVKELRELPSNRKGVEDGKVSLHKNTKKSKANRKNI